jgi:hypothetical protein
LDKLKKQNQAYQGQLEPENKKKRKKRKKKQKQIPMDD